VNLNQLERLRELVIQLEKSPHVTTETLQSGVAQSLLQFKDTGPPNVSQQANMALSLLGYVPPYKGKGLRILAIDGGGTRWVGYLMGMSDGEVCSRGLIPIILLQHLERISGLKVYEMFDYVSGTSTGTLLASNGTTYELPWNIP
jgi:calcium-independent phospholipase A2-gamma